MLRIRYSAHTLMSSIVSGEYLQNTIAFSGSVDTAALKTVYPLARHADKVERCLDTARTKAPEALNDDSMAEVLYLTAESLARKAERKFQELTQAAVPPLIPTDAQIELNGAKANLIATLEGTFRYEFEDAEDYFAYLRSVEKDGFRNQFEPWELEYVAEGLYRPKN